jgi:signal transduction histidine kinase/DNA-binding response OmpR family regulator
MSWILIPLASALVAWLVVAVWQRRQREIARRLQRTEADLRRLQDREAARIRFFGNIVHELRTPLSLVLGQIDAAAVEVDAGRRGHQLRVAARNARRLSRLADQALALTRLHVGAVEPQAREVDSVPFLESLVMSFEELADRKGVLLEFFARPRSIACRLDADQLTTIVSNLLSNAFKYTPAGGRVGVAVDTLPATTGTDRRGTLRITVADTGPGIAPDRQAEIFEPFMRGPDAARLHPDGAGIGLALAREMARAQGGDLTVESAVGRGARFLVELPLHARRPVPAAPPLLAGGVRPPITDEILYRTSAEEQPPHEDATDRPRILVVEDSADAREWLRDGLMELGDVMGAAGGRAALEQAQQSVPDLILTDLRMADMDGIELCHRLRADERTSHIPIIMLSVISAVDQRIAGLEAGADEYVSKPVEARELRVRVATLLARRRELREQFRERVVVKPSDVSPRSVDQAFFEKVTSTIEARIDDEEFSVPQLAAEMAMSASQLTRKLRALVNRAPGELIRSLRLQRAADLITARAGNIAEIGYRVGFRDQSHFSRTFKRHFGKAPSDYRRDSVAPTA